MNIRPVLFGFAAYATLCPTPAQAIIMRMIFETSAGVNIPTTGQSVTAGSELATAGPGTIGEYTFGTMVTAMKPTLVSGLSTPSRADNTDMAGIAVSGDKLFVANFGTGTISGFNTSGVKLKLDISGLKQPLGIAVSGDGDDLFVATKGGTISEFTTLGAQVNLNLITGLKAPIGIAVSGEDLFVASMTKGGTIGEYTTSGGKSVLINTINTGKTAGLHNLEGIAVGGGDLFVVDHKGVVGEYNAKTGALLKPALVRTGLKNPIGIAVDQGDLFVVNHTGGKNGFGTIAEFDATTGKPIATTLVSGLNGPSGIVIVPVPDASSTWTLLLLGLAAMFGLKPLLRTPA
jgi:DNA-binding beta-propeller fold protein YncE